MSFRLVYLLSLLLIGCSPASALAQTFFYDEVDREQGKLFYGNPVSQEILFTLRSADSTLVETINNTFDGHGNLIQSTRTKSNFVERVTYTYDDDQRVTKIATAWNDRLNEQRIAYFDENQKVIKEYFKDNVFVDRRVIHRISSVSKIDDTILDQFQQTDTTVHIFYRKVAGLVVEEIQPSRGVSYTFKYSNNKLKEILEGNNKTIRKFEYDEFDSLVSESTYAEDGTVKQLHKYLYKNGIVTSQYTYAKSGELIYWVEVNILKEGKTR